MFFNELKEVIKEHKYVPFFMFGSAGAFSTINNRFLLIGGMAGLFFYGLIKVFKDSKDEPKAK